MYGKCDQTILVKATSSTLYCKLFIVLPRDQVTVGVGAPFTLQTSCRRVPMTTVSLWGLSMKNGAIPGAHMINNLVN